jgi:hypothetical protein
MLGIVGEVTVCRCGRTGTDVRAGAATPARSAAGIGTKGVSFAGMARLLEVEGSVPRTRSAHVQANEVNDV